MLDGDITEILENHAYLGAVKNNDSDAAQELLDKLPPFATLGDLVAQLKASNELTFKVVFGQRAGHYLIKCFLVSEYSVSKALFISDVDIFRQMRDPAARVTVAKRIVDEFLVARDANDPPPRKRQSVFEQMTLERRNSSQPPPNVGKSSNHNGNLLQPLPIDSNVVEVPSNPQPHQSLLQAMTNSIGVYGPNVTKAIDLVASGQAPSTMFDEISGEVMHDLQFDVFPRFLNSPFFERYIRAKSYESKTITINDFFMMRVLGRGGFGTVRACNKMDTSTMYAAKMIDKKRVQGTNSLKYIMLERDLLAAVDSRFVIGLKYALEDKNNLYFMLDLMTGGDLRFQLNEHKQFPEERARFYAAEILLGLTHIHSKGIIYRDLKLENVLLDDKGHCKISDLGLAVQSTKPIRGYAGTPGYIAPEVIQDKPYDKAADYFSFGVLIYRMLSGRAPFDEKVSGDDDRDKAVLNATAVYPPEYFQGDVISLLKGLLEKDPKHRLGAEGVDQIKQHPWFENTDWGLIEAGHIDAPFVPTSDRVNAESMQGVYNTEDDDKYRKVKLTPEFNKAIANFTYKSPSAIQNEITEVMMRADQGINFEMFAPPQPPRHRKKKDGDCAVM
ncbi:hypothetical protein PBRA_008407 [Plasmodiophora brassicae]|uniref:G protein-coupled receptor kinase n=1 Tax=Plasmodiophora brassicae TaxID=37360 RepID=A0A0G4J0N3_PLABS|nr:hypothetical protein PBRA_008407 [Plasmodiophora brassicae]